MIHPSIHLELHFPLLGRRSDAGGCLLRSGARQGPPLDQRSAPSEYLGIRYFAQGHVGSALKS